MEAAGAPEPEEQLHDLLPYYKPSEDLGPGKGQTMAQYLSSLWEFRELELGRKEVPRPGKLFRHQTLTQRFMTVFDNALNISATGTGKTCGFMAGSVTFRDNPQMGIHTVVFLTKNSALAENSAMELVRVCNPEGFPSISRRIFKSQMALKKAVTGALPEITTKTDGTPRDVPFRYVITTYKSFSNRYVKMSDGELLREFSGTYFGVDEIHRITPDSVSEGDRASFRETRARMQSQRSARPSNYNVFSYLFLHHLFHLLRGRRKVMLMSATPIVKRFVKLQSIVNLIREEQLAHGESWWSRASLEDFAEIFSNLILFVRAFEEGVLFRPTGSSVSRGGESFVMFSLGMVEGGVQLETYRRLVRGCAPARPGAGGGQPGCSLEDPEEEVKDDEETFKASERRRQNDSFYNKLRSSAVFVWPDGEVGERAMDEWVKRVDRGEKRGRGRPKKTVKLRHRASQELLGYLKDREKLRSLSVRHATLLDILDREDEEAAPFPARARVPAKARRFHFEFMYFVKNNIESLGLTLQANGYRRYFTGSPLVEEDHYRRFGIITAETHDSDRTAILELSRRPDNFDGRLLRIVIGSSTVMEGVSFRNCTSFGQTIQWKESDNYQALSRILRALSHTDLLQLAEGSLSPAMREVVEDRRLPGESSDQAAERLKALVRARYDWANTGKIVIEARFYNVFDPREGPGKSIDSQVYLAALLLGRAIGQKMRMLKQVAADCPFTRARNVREEEQPLTSGCDYQESCVYDCYGEPFRGEPDDGNFTLLYSQELVAEIEARLRVLLAMEPFWSVSGLSESLPERLRRYVPGVLDSMQAEKRAVVDRLGFKSYVAVQGDSAFLVRSFPMLPHLDLPSPEYARMNSFVELSRQREEAEPPLAEGLVEEVLEGRHNADVIARVFERAYQLNPDPRAPQDSDVGRLLDRYAHHILLEGTGRVVNAIRSMKVLNSRHGLGTMDRDPERLRRKIRVFDPRANSWSRPDDHDENVYSAAVLRHRKERNSHMRDRFPLWARVMTPHNDFLIVDSRGGPRGGALRTGVRCENAGSLQNVSLMIGELGGSGRPGPRQELCRDLEDLLWEKGRVIYN